MNNSEEFEKKAKVLLEQSLNDLSPDIARRLQQARYAALEKAKPRSIWSFYPQAATAAFIIAIISVGLFFNFDNKHLNKIELAMEVDIEMLTTNENLDLIEDLEFMQWLVEIERYAS